MDWRLSGQRREALAMTRASRPLCDGWRGGRLGRAGDAAPAPPPSPRPTLLVSIYPTAVRRPQLQSRCRVCPSPHQPVKISRRRRRRPPSLARPLKCFPDASSEHARAARAALGTRRIGARSSVRVARDRAHDRVQVQRRRSATSLWRIMGVAAEQQPRHAGGQCLRRPPSHGGYV